MKKTQLNLTKFFGTLVFILTAACTFAQLSGTYTINPSGSGGRNYTTFGAAVSALTSSGVNGAVTFDVSSATFSEQVSIGSISGVSSTNTVTFKGAGTSSTKLTYSSSSSTARHTLRLTGCDWVNFEDMTIEGTGTYRWAVQVMSTTGSSFTTDCMFKNCVMTVGANSSSLYIPVVLNNSTSSNTSGGLFDRITFYSCTIDYGYYGLSARGLSTSSRFSNLKVEKCIFKNFGFYGLYSYYAEAPQILNNDFTKGSYTTSGYPIYMYYVYSTSTDKARLIGNMMNNSGVYGMATAYWTGTSTNYCEIYNNVVLGNSTYTYVVPLYLYSVTYVNVYHNTLACNTSYNNVYGSIYAYNPSYVNIKNNTLIGNGIQPGLYYYSSSGGPSSTNTDIDYNNYYNWTNNSSGILIYAYTGSYNSYDASNFTGFGGSNSQSIHQGWSSLTDLKISDGCVNGVSGLGITKDILDSTRNTPPDIGAYEAKSANYDAGIAELISPKSPASSSTPVQAIVKNFGATSINSLDVSYKVGASSANQQTFSFSTPLAACKSDTIKFTNNASFSTCTDFKIYTQNINTTQTDQNNTNDTVGARIGVGISGTFTVGGSGADYSSINAAIADLQCGGISGPVVFKLASATFNEQVEIGPISGTSATNTITFIGAGTSSTKISYSSSSSNDRHTVRLNKATGIIFRDLTVEASGTYAWAVQVMDNSKDCKFLNCNIKSVVGSSTNYLPVVLNNSVSSYSIGGNSERIVFDSCSISGGYFAVIAYGTSGSRHTNTEIRNSTITDFYYYGVYSYYSHNTQFINNKIIATSNSNASNYSCVFYYADATSNGNADTISRIYGNRVSKAGYYGFYLVNGQGQSSANSEFINNIVEGNLTSTYPNAVYFSGCYNWNVYHNTIATNVSNGVYYAAFSADYCSNVKVMNNTFIGTGTSPAVYDYNGGITYDYNNYLLSDNSSNNLIYDDYNSAGYNSTNFKNFGGSNSYNADQLFSSITELKISNGCVNGTNLGITKDIDGNSRNNPPDVGAYEASSAAYDAGVNALVSPAVPFGGGTTSIVATVKNFGSTALDSLVASYSLNGNTPVVQTFYFSTPLAPCGTINITFSTTATINSCTQIKVWTGKVNGQNDAEVSNDTLIKQIGVSVSGTFTVGGSSPDFTNLNAAIAGLQCGGISGPVTLLVRPGTYQGQVDFPMISGMSSTNTVTITSSTGNTADVTFTDSGTTLTNKHTFRLTGVSYYNFRNITVENKGLTYGCGIHILNGSSDINIVNCNINGPTGNSSSYVQNIMINGGDYYYNGAQNFRIKVDSCNLMGAGYYGNLVLYGGSSSAMGEDNVVSNTMCSGAYYFGIYSYYQTGSVVDNNTLGSSNGYGFYGYWNMASSSKAALKFINNKVQSYYMGAYFYNCDGTSSDPTIIANNQIGAGFGNATTYGIYSSSSDYVNCYFNSVYMKGGSGTAYGLYSTSSTYWDIENNHFVIGTGNSTSSYPMYISTNTGHTVDYNNYYNMAGTYLLYRSSTYTNTSSWNSSSSGGANSFNQNVDFVSDLNLNMVSACSPTGTPITGFGSDRYGTSRSTTAPMLGAHEVIQFAYDAGVIDILAPSNPVNTSTAYDVTLVVKNFGSTTITSIEAGYTINGTPVSTTFSSLSLGSCDTVHLTLSGASAVMFSSGVNKLRGFTGNINGTNPDAEHSNDTSGIFQYCGTISGSFTINPVGSGTTNFTSFADAIGALNSCGVSGAVTITVSPGTYNEQVNLTGIITGSSSVNTVTFDGVDPLTRIISFNGTSSSSDATLRLLGTKYITIKNLGIKNMGTTYAMGVRIGNNGSQHSDSVAVQGCRIEVPTYNGSVSSYWIGIGVTPYTYYVSSYSGGELAENITIDGNTIIGGYYGYASYGHASYYNSNYKIINNTFNSQYYRSLYLYYYHDKAIIDNNKFNDVGVNYYTSSAAIHSYYNSGTSITRNRVCGQIGIYAFYSFYENTLLSDSSLIANNSISIGDPNSTNTIYGMYVYYPTRMVIGYNTVKIASNSSSSTPIIFNTTSTSYNGNRIINNNFVNTGSGYAVYLTGSNSSTVQACLDQLDNNNYFSNGSYAMRFINNIFPTSQLYIWSSSSYAGSNNDLNTLSVNPDFPGDCDLSTLSLALDSNGTPNNRVTTDINGNTRNTTHPDIGAFEYDGPNYNLKVTSITMPNAPVSAGTNDVKVVIENAGYATITSATVSYKINAAGTPVSISYSGSLPFGASDTVTFTGSNAYTLAAGVKDSLYAFTSQPNGFADQYTKNDTVVKCICEALSGVYTVNGSGTKNFGTLSDAVSSLNQCGVAGAVTLNIKPGTYMDRVVLNAIPGVSATNNVTIQGATGNATDVNITYASTGLSDNGTVVLNFTDYVTFRNLTLSNTGTSYANVLILNGSNTDGSDNNTIDSCILRGVYISSTSSNYALVSSLNQFNNGLVISNSKLLNGSSGIYLSGNPVINAFTKDWVIKGNTIDSQYYNGMYFYYTENLKIQDNKIMHNSPTTSKYGIQCYYNEGASEISGNQILFDNGASSCMFFNYHNTYYRSDTAIIFNNFFSQPSGSYCNYMYYNRAVAYFNNSIYMGSGSYAIYAPNGYSPNANLFINNTIKTGASYGLYTINYAPDYCDYNNYSTSSNVGYFNTAYSTLSSWKGALYSGSDANSISVDPMYTSTTDLHAKAEGLVGAALPVGLSIDIDGDPRNSTTPVIGADEYVADIEAVRVTGPVAAACNRGQETVTVTLKNVGQSVVSNIPVSLQVNSGTAVSETYTGSLNPGDSVNYTFTAKADLSTVGNNTITVTASRSIDYNTSNNTATLTVLHASNPVAGFTHKDTCFGGTVSFTNTSTVGHGTISGYSWDFDNGNSSTATNPTQAFAGVGPYNVKLTATSSYGCTGTITKSVNILTDLNPGSVGSAQTICYNGTPAMLTNTASASGSGGTYQYQWQMSTDGSTFSDITGATGATYQPGSQTAARWYRRAVSTSLGCGPKYSTAVKITNYDMLAAGSIGSAQNICHNTTPAAITQSSAATGGDGSFSYKWEQSADNSTWFTITGATNANYAPGNLTATTYYRRTDIGGSSCGQVTTNTVKITVYNPLSGGTFQNTYDICPNTSPGTLTQTSAATGGDGTFTYTWEMSTDNINWSTITGATAATYTPGNISVTTYYRRKATGGSGCGSIYANTVTVEPRPLPAAAFNTSNHCIGDPVPLVNNSTPGFGTLTGFAWDFGGGVTSSQNTPNYTYPSGGNKSIKLVVTNSIGCKDSITKTISVSNIPNASFSYLYDCNNDSLRFKNTTSVNCGKINSFYWNLGDGTSSTLENPVHKYANPGTYNITFVIYLSGSITDTAKYVLTIYPKANLGFTVSDVCYGDVSQFVNTSTNATSYFWKFGDATTSNATNPTKLYATSGSYSVTLEAVSLNGCNFSVTKTHVVKVRPDADIVSGNSCLGDSIYFGNGSIYSHTYLWSFGDGSTSTQATPAKRYAAAGTYTVKLVATNNNGCVDSTTGKATVYSLPTAAFNVSNACFGQDITFSNQSSGAVSYAWNMGDGSNSATTSPVYRYATAGTYNVTLTATSGFGCKHSITKSVTVNPQPKAGFTTANVCSGTQASFTNTSSISSGTVSYMWYFGDGSSSTATSPTKSYASAGAYTVKLVATSGFGCSDSISSTITIYPGAVADFTAGTACLGSAVNFTNNSQNATTYSWNFGDGTTSTQANPSKTYAAAGTYTVTLTASNSNNCSSVVSKSVTVSPVPSVSFSGSNVCQGTATSFTNTSSITSGTLTYSWDFGDGSSSTATNPTRTYASAGSYTVRLTATSSSNCSATGSSTVQVYANPVAGFSAGNACAGAAIQFSNTSSGATTYSWNFGDATTSTQANPSKTYAAAGTYTVTLTATSANNCVNIISKTVTVYAAPTADFSSSTVCSGNATVFTNSSTGAVSYNWQFGDGGSSTSASPSYMYATAGSYTATLVATSSNGCKAQVSKTVTVNSTPVAGFTAANVCVGSAINFSNTSTGATSYSWSFGDATTSTQASPSKTYATAGTYTVTLTATSASNCVNVISKTVTVYAAPVAGFSTSDVCLGSSMVFSNSSTGAVLYNWQFGDGSSSPLTSPVKSYSAAGSYNVTLTATSANGCSNSSSKTVIVNPNPVAGFSSSVVCTDNTAQLTNSSTISSGTMTYSWDFGDASTGTQTNPTHTFPAAGSYTVTLTATSNAGCKATVQNIVSVSKVAVAGFSAAEVCAGTATVFNNTSTDAASSSWQFGDGGTSTAMFPTHSYASAGTYTVTLTVQGNNGCSNSISKTVTVNANPVAGFTAANACQGVQVSISNTSTGADSYEWYYGFTGPDKVTTPNISLNNVGSTTIRLVAITAKGCRSETSRTIEIYSRPKAAFSVTNTCQGDQTRFVNTSLNGNSYNWQFGDGNNSGNSNPSHQYAAAGNYNVTLTASNAQCSDAVTQSITVNALPSSDFTFSTSGKQVSFTAGNTTNVKGYDWNFGDGLSGSGQTPQHLYNNAIVQVFSVCLKVTDNNTCQSETCKNVSIDLLGKEELSTIRGISIYPNPSRGMFTVSAEGSGDRAMVSVYSLMGVKVAEGHNSGNDTYTIDGNGLSAGSYMVKVSVDGKTSVYPVAITR